MVKRSDGENSGVFISEKQRTPALNQLRLTGDELSYFGIFRFSLPHYLARVASRSAGSSSVDWCSPAENSSHYRSLSADRGWVVVLDRSFDFPADSASI